MNDRTDQKLVAASKKGDKAAYARLVEKHYSRVFAVCLAILGNTHDAEDIAQDAMLRGFLKIKRLGKARRFSSWITRIAENLCIDLVRRKQHVKAILAAAQPRRTSPARENLDLHHSIRLLPRELRLPLLMYYFDEKSTANIAKTMNISHSGACRRIRQARKQLYELLNQEPQNEK